MPNFESEAHYLASLTPPSVAAGVGRRNFLKGAAGAGAALTLPGLLAACGGDDEGSSGGSGGEPTGTVSFGSNEAGGDVPQMRRDALVAAYEKESGLKVAINAVDHNTFQENINNYLQGNPDDVFSWFAGYRMQFFAERGLIGDVSDVWPIDGVGEAFQKASTGSDGKQYFVPDSNYPWVVLYRKSFWDERGYTAPTTYDEMITLAQQMKTDGLSPFAFADKQGWPAMGTFDILNMRINGYDYHVSLMAGEESWDSTEVRNVFDQWRELLEYAQPDALGRDWEEAAQSLVANKSGMYYLGLFAFEQFPEDERDDVGFFNFPEIDSSIGADAIDAPIDGYCMAADPDNEDGAKDFLKFIPSKEAADTLSEAGYPLIWANSNADLSSLQPIQQEAAEFIAQQSSIAQFLDRDTRPDFASTVMIPSIQEFIKNPNDVEGLTKKIEEKKKSIFV
jgi:multiple sugar transport system substrate-binding protein